MPPTPHTAQSCIQELQSSLGSDQVSTTNGDLKPYSKDNSYHTQRFPTAVVYVKSELDISKVGIIIFRLSPNYLYSNVLTFLKALSICNKHKIPVIPFAAGSSLEGHIIPEKSTLETRGTITLDVSQMDKILAIHPNDLAIVVEPGVNWIDLRQTLEPHRVFFPPDPGAAACIGGMCGTNCSGSLAYRYGTMKDNILGLRVVLADGRVITTRGMVTKSSAGYDLTRLIVGSEGTLGIVSQAILRVRRIAECTSVALVQFEKLSDACKYINKLVISGPDTIHRIEFMDDYCIRSINITTPNWSLPEQFTVLIEFCGNTHTYIEEQSKICEEFAKIVGASSYKSAASEPEECERYWSVRKKALFAAKALHPQHKTLSSLSTLVTDVAVPISKIGDILAYSRELIEKYKLIATIVAHAGDGNFHALILCDRNNADEVKRVEHVRDLMAERAIQLNGTCTGEHGVGKGKRELLVKELGSETINVMRTIKKALDPNFILNPGKVFTVEDESKFQKHHL
ncbi:hypothetical protein HK096_009135 [Nowakowskiella sp. JEL0078]|nr:hypothetical protein HK096_009135 [Nowakowskiella sp. JEL0078]